MLRRKHVYYVKLVDSEGQYYVQAIELHTPLKSKKTIDKLLEAIGGNLRIDSVSLIYRESTLGMCTRATLRVLIDLGRSLLFLDLKDKEVKNGRGK